MTRFDSSNNQTEAEKQQQRIGVLASLDFSSGFVRLTDRDHDVAFGGNTYLGIGQLGTIEAVREDAEIRPYALRLTLSGVDNSLLSTALTEDYHGRVARLYVGWFDENNALKADPEPVFKGSMDHMAVTLGERFGTIALVCENEWARWTRPKPILNTQESQDVFYTTDLIFNQAPFQKHKKVRWGGGIAVNPASGGGGVGTGGSGTGPGITPVRTPP